MKLAEYEQSAARKIIVYGPPKTGKTDLVGQLAAKKKLWWFDLEDGIKTLLASPRMKREWFDNIELFKLPDTQINPIACRTLLKVIKGGPKKICWNHGAVDCPICKRDESAKWNEINLSTFTNNDIMVIDSATQTAQSAMNDIQYKAIMADEFDKKPTWDDYFNQGRIMDRIFSIVQQANFNVVVISHETMTEMEDGSKKIVPVGGTREFSSKFAKYFDDVVYCEIVNKRHNYSCSSTYKNNVISGSRANRELNKEKPNLLELFA